MSGGEENDQFWNELDGKAPGAPVKMDDISAEAGVGTDDGELTKLPVSSKNPEEELRALRTMKHALKEDIAAMPQHPDLVGDIRLLRFLRANLGNADKAIQQYRKMIKWRAEHNVEAIRKEIVENNVTPRDLPVSKIIVQYVPYLWVRGDIEKEDEREVVLLCERTGHLYVSEIVKHINMDDWIEYFIYENEFNAIDLDKRSRKAGDMVSIKIIRDLEGLSVSQASREGLKYLHAMMMFDETYPAAVSHMALCNTPYAFTMIWGLIKPWFTEEQLERLRMWDSDYHNKLRELVPNKLIPSEVFGGENKSANFPESHLERADPFEKMVSEGANEVTVAASNVQQLPFNLQPGDTVYWEFALQGYDVSFSVVARVQGVGGAEEKVVVPEESLSSGIIHSGSFKAESPGTVVLTWDNSYSWTRSKTLAYKVSTATASNLAEGELEASLEEIKKDE